MKIIWLTGKSGSGKTTLAKALQAEYDCIILDGDQMRQSISVDAGFSRKDRAAHNFKVARLAKVLSEQKMVIVSVIAPMAKVREIIDKICSPVWIYIKRTLPERAGHFYEKPDSYPIIDNDRLTVREATLVIKKIINEKN